MPHRYTIKWRSVHVRNALLSYPPELRERITVVAVAPGAYIYSETCKRVTHYRTEDWWRDIVPRIDQKGAKREKKTIVGLESHEDAGLFDHSFSSPTYHVHLRQEIGNFIKGAPH